MGRYTDGAIDAFKESFNLNLLLHYGALLLLFVVAIIAIAIPFFIAIIVGAVFLGTGAPNAVAAIAFAALVIFFILIYCFVAAHFGAVCLNSAKRHLDGKPQSISESLKVPFGKTLKMLVVSLLFATAFLILLAILLLPSFMLVIDALQKLSPASFSASGFGLPEELVTAGLGFILNLSIAILIIALLALILAPITNMIMPVILFEDKGILDSLGRAKKMGLENYLPSIGYVLIEIALIMTVAIAFQIGYFFSGLLGILGVPLYFALYIISMIYNTAVSYLFIAKLYNLNTSGNATASETGALQQQPAKPRFIEKTDSGQAWVKAAAGNKKK